MSTQHSTVNATKQNWASNRPRSVVDGVPYSRSGSDSPTHAQICVVRFMCVCTGHILGINGEKTRVQYLKGYDLNRWERV